MRSAKKKHKYYFPNNLKRWLNQIPQYSLTVVEASSGFGKTTAVREYLRNKHPNATCRWYTCLGESCIEAWIKICELFDGINSKAADDMKSLKMPTTDTFHYIRTYLKKMKCHNETYLIIDNYHLIDFDIHRELINVFSMHENQNLHMIFITQRLDFRWQLYVCNDNINIIDAASLLFNREDISCLFSMEGFKITDSEAENIYKRTEGWVSAIRLQLLHYGETGLLVGSAGIEQLVKTAIWDWLLPEQKDFLLAVSVFDSFTTLHSAHMLDYEILPGELGMELKNSDFIQFLPDKRRFVIRSVLLDYLRNQFYYHNTKEYQNRMFHKAGCACAAMREYCLAAKYFYQIRDFDAILSMHFTRRYLDSQKEVFDDELFIAIVRECPDEILYNYPSSMIVLAQYSLLNGKYNIYEKLCGLLSILIEKEKIFSREEKRRIEGEFVLLKSLENFNDLSKMRKRYAMLSEIWGDEPEIIENSTPWFSVFPTTFGMLWRESGTLEELLHTIDEIKPIYRTFSRGQDAGLAHLIRAEAVLARGDDNEAEILCYKALYEARANRQTGICIYTEFCLARIFILRGETESFFAKLKSIQGYASDNSDLTVLRMTDMCLSIISLLLGVKDYVAPWLYDIESIRKSMYVPVIPFVEIIHFGLLLFDKRYNELYALSQLALDALQNPYTDIKYMMPQMDCFIFLAVAKYNSGEDLEAQRYLKKALDIAMPDKIYLPFASHECIADFLSARGNSFAGLLSLCKRHARGISVIRKSFIRKDSPLTPREREIALLAKKRLSAKEIAQRLYISERTVKSTLGRVYSKLEIHSKTELASVEF